MGPGARNGSPQGRNSKKRPSRFFRGAGGLGSLLPALPSSGKKPNPVIEATNPEICQPTRKFLRTANPEILPPTRKFMDQPGNFRGAPQPGNFGTQPGNLARSTRKFGSSTRKFRAQPGNFPVGTEISRLGREFPGWDGNFPVGTLEFPGWDSEFPGWD